jgi:hypothetical protein
MSSGGDSISTCGLAALRRYGRQACVVTNVPRVLIPNIKSKRFGSVISVGVSDIALALLTQMSMPPKRSAACAAAPAPGPRTLCRTRSAGAWPPAFSISAAA